MMSVANIVFAFDYIPMITNIKSGAGMVFSELKFLSFDLFVEQEKSVSNTIINEP